MVKFFDLILGAWSINLSLSSLLAQMEPETVVSIFSKQLPMALQNYIRVRDMRAVSEKERISAMRVQVTVARSGLVFEWKGGEGG